MPISICNEVLPAPSSLSFRVPNNGSEPITELFSYFQEFEETELNAKLGYQQPEDLRNDNTTFYWKKVSSHFQRAPVYLKLIPDGRQWIASLQANIGEPIVSP